MSNKRILIAYSTTDGYTQKICQRLCQVIERQNQNVSVMPIGDVQDSDLNSYGKIVIGASIRYGKHSKEVYDFIKRNKQTLDSKPNAFFSVNVVARKPAKNRPDTNPYMKKFLKQITWQPKQLAVFAGKINYQLYSFRDKQIIRLIMWLTNGPTDPATNVEFTDWGQVDAFGKIVSGM
jgi:menaquinone-dependent protoporphyrinogen oxidase